ncbi:RED-like protein N-terminal region-domain-containing protein [Glomus cerebriforme]|uniref:RED-like protein N-terminal region-domain-containing protein n=1 Tax=Glomus cerebriforme TaxID=658196 RepID=A0A397TUK3_9GLOM|nr:RED-like protein N-terminal region-domain-containing protein [Glomus cerebriforme]
MSELNGQENKQKGLKQDDFRKLLQTPRPGDTPSKGILGMATPKQRMPPQTPKPGGSGGFAKPEAPASKSKKKYKRPETSEEKLSDNKYRDRAAERRTGANPDYHETEQILKALNNSETLEAKLVYEQSKYLGGDTEHTHLVKGLDFALLNKVRNEIQQGDDQNDEELEHALERIKEESQAVPKINSKMAQNIYEIAVVNAKKKPPKVNELFVAGRMAYIFEMADENGFYGDPFAIPTTVIRSKADIADSTGIDKSTNDLVIEKISRVMAYVRKGGRDGGAEVKDKKLKKKIKEKQPDVVVPVKYAAIDESEDIFEDVGRDYIAAPDEPEENKKDDEPMIGPVYGPSRPLTQPVEVENYFKGDDMDIDDEKPKNEDLKSLINKVASASGIKQTEEIVKGSEVTDNNKSSTKIEGVKKRLYEHDSYEGNYSTYGLGLSSLGGGTRKNAYDSGHEDSDSEGEVHTIRDQGVAKNKKAQLSRWDFDTEEEWLSYKDNVTAMPKSAFQFGVKKTDGRKTRRSGKELSEKQKLDRDWQKISKIMEQKYGDGDEGDSSRKKAKHE